MSRPLMSALTLALMSTMPALSDAATHQRFSASATLVPNTQASGGRFNLQAQLLEPGAPLPSDAKKPAPVHGKSVTASGPTSRFKLLAAVRDVNAPAGELCAVGTIFRNGFE